MGWLIEALANVFLELLGDMMSWSIMLLTDFKFDIGLNVGRDTGQTFTPGQIVNPGNLHANLLEETFPAAKAFTPFIIAFALGIVMFMLIAKLYVAFGGPFTKSEDPATIVVRAIFAAFGVAYGYSIFVGMEALFNFTYRNFMRTFVDQTKLARDYAQDITDPYVISSENENDSESDVDRAEAARNQHSYGNPEGQDADHPEDAFDMFGKDIIGGYEEGQGVGLTIIEIALFAVLLIAYAKLLMEIYERYVMIGVLYYFAPLAFATVVSKNMNVMGSYIQMVICEFIVMCSNLFFTGVFINAWVHILRSSDPYLFKTPSEFVIKMFLLISWLVIGQQFDGHLKSLGLSTAQTGQGLGGAVLAGAASAYAVGRMAVGAARSGVRLGTNVATGNTAPQKAYNALKSARDAAREVPTGNAISKGDASGFFSALGDNNSEKARAFNGMDKTEQMNAVRDNAAALAGGEDKLNSMISKQTGGQGYNDIASMSYDTKSGDIEGKTANGARFAFHNNNSGMSSEYNLNTRGAQGDLTPAATSTNSLEEAVQNRVAEANAAKDPYGNLFYKDPKGGEIMFNKAVANPDRPGVVDYMSADGRVLAHEEIDPENYSMNKITLPNPGTSGGRRETSDEGSKGSKN